MKNSEIAKKHGVSDATFYKVVQYTKKQSKIKKYRCLNCGQEFTSNLSKIDAYCPGVACNKTTEIEEI